MLIKKEVNYQIADVSTACAWILLINIFYIYPFVDLEGGRITKKNIPRTPHPLKITARLSFLQHPHNLMRTTWVRVRIWLCLLQMSCWWTNRCAQLPKSILQRWPLCCIWWEEIRNGMAGTYVFQYLCQSGRKGIERLICNSNERPWSI